jgi:hypothetical protein
MTRDQILIALASGPKTTEQLRTILNATYDRIHNSAKRLVAAGKVVFVSNVYALAVQNQNVGKLSTKPSGSKLSAPLFTPPPTPRRIVNRFIICLDKSSSMGPLRVDALAGLNHTIDEIMSQAFKSGQETTISYYEFGSYVERKFLNQDAKTCKRVLYYNPAGMTALFNCVEDAISDHLNEPVTGSNVDVSYCVITITDGYNNSSRDNTGNTMKRAIARATGTDRWTFAFQVPPGNKYHFCQNYGIPQGNVMEWEASSVGMEQAFNANRASTRSYFTSRAAGQTKSTSFYTDLSNLDPNKVKFSLKDIKSQVKVWEVPAEGEIKPFVESRTGRPYVLGEAFYELTKPETIQPYKKLLVMERGSRSVYAGDEARTLIGMPVGTDVRVKPGNHANFRIFPQSTSVNRKVVRGTSVIDWPGAVL